MSKSPPPKPTASSPGRRGRPPKLDAEKVVDAALRLLDSEGLSAVSLRRIGRDLRVSHMALYSHFAAKEDLLEAMVARTLDVPATDADSQLPWDEALANVIREIHAALVARPGIAELLVTHEFTGEWVGRVRDRLLSILARAGYDRAQTVDGISVLFNYLLGTVMIETSRRPGGSPSSFDFGLELLVDGLRDRAPVTPGL